ncbi:hypothetical protein [Aureimonas glaciei]|uniref:Uncharacterized protein n=1 Tax=Aureimonas glaciei TaxID=1776957 RepID=A0A916YFM9_9HYPH|nr:hypothetical protein [Aureimonas glaciei]GGD43601.1 hypothetical protein GCM10011335_52770 [Aureimonas glaciei]
MQSIIRTSLSALVVAGLMTASALAQSGGTGTAPAAPATTEKQFPLPRAGDKATQIELITGLCGIQMKQMSEPACHCLAEQTLTGLSDPQRDYLIATVVSPPVADRMLADNRVGKVDQEAIFAFLTVTSDACATGTFVAGKAAPTAPGMPAPTAPAPATAPATPVKPAP